MKQNGLTISHGFRLGSVANLAVVAQRRVNGATPLAVVSPATIAFSRFNGPSLGHLAGSAGMLV